MSKPLNMLKHHVTGAIERGEKMAIVSTNYINSQAIETKYLGPTNHRGTRIKATCAAGSITVGWNHEHNADKNYYEAAFELYKKLGWNETCSGLVGGTLKNGHYVFVVMP